MKWLAQKNKNKNTTLFAGRDGLDSLTGTDRAKDHTRFHNVLLGFYGWMPCLMPTPLQSVLGEVLYFEVLMKKNSKL